jgi:hypothetical protein
MARRFSRRMKNDALMVIGRLAGSALACLCLLDGIHRGRFSTGPQRSIRLDEFPFTYYFIAACIFCCIFIYLAGAFQSLRALLKARWKTV